MPSRRSRASTSPRSVQAAASFKIRSFSADVNLRRWRLGVLSTAAPLSARALEVIGFPLVGLGTVHDHSPPFATEISRGSCLKPRWHRGLLARVRSLSFHPRRLRSRVGLCRLRVVGLSMRSKALASSSALDLTGRRQFSVCGAYDHGWLFPL